MNALPQRLPVSSYLPDPPSPIPPAAPIPQALQHHYTPAQLASRRRVEVHVLGASGFEVPADRIWEELLNLLPPYVPAKAPVAPTTDAASGAAADAKAAVGDNVADADDADEHGAGPRELHVAFVGPELSDIIVEDSDGLALPQGSALAVLPPPPGRAMLYSYHLAPYQDWVAGRKPRRDGDGGGVAAAVSGARPAAWRRPDLAVAFNSGMSESDQKLWAPALEALIRHAVPVVFTSYNDQEAAADAGVWRAAGGQVTHGPERNPFRVLEPVAEPSEVDVFYHQNYYWWCGRAAAAGAAAATREP
ncbi:hypothetical protein GPECTOR_5g367 [Gonium pectorale]|uniref:Mitochondrial splicing suppressor 51-like C-terminal domain-containing protein n=1 Tax=Gonium pectorale TaxID=33097 RepID=A0A150GWU7_GONPE|nr:hypothetical protein GPECTOR_5g367 [Gonium pectorale]|eukprot:KXZ54279.1 hypothetical protein GPECTOR_5g367 [Gonium pectorale]